MPIYVTFFYPDQIFFLAVVVGNTEKILLHGSVNKVCYWFPLHRIGEQTRQQQQREKEKVFNKN